ncbi:amidohydrolase family protein [Hymenobacter lapidiphilus]|uniref:Amidohydrolase family protein n=1 Tax=Hymenobacter lapidiphilus TaxID=2608003 RepID=A0A7Y7U5V0_9BACT|nr:amidohydrolase family protein [Hymenobacter lapidiphilus]NVO31828.1 amidohydrolase family protein [Hymenobacter lapidiphilus]
MNQDTVLRRQTVLIERGQIKIIGAANRVKSPAGAVRLNGRGKYLLPGLVDTHAHLPGKEGTLHPLNTYFRLQLAAGVVGLRSMRGDSSHLHWRDSLRRTAALAPRLYLGSPVFNRDQSYSARKGRAILARYQTSGYDFAKYLGGLTVPQYDSLLTDAHQLGFKVAGHAPASGVGGAVAARMASIEHIEAFIRAYQQDSVQLQQLARQMAADQIFTCPDLYWYEVNWLQYPLDYLQRLPGLAYVSSPVRQEWQQWWTTQNQQLPPAARPQFTAALRTYGQAFRIMHKAGVQFLISPGDGPFVVPGYGMAQELGLLVKLGLSPYEALRAATYNAAVWLGEQDQRGTLEPGKAADLVLLDANPLENIANIGRVRGVVLNGRWVSVAQLLPAQP